MTSAAIAELEPPSRVACSELLGQRFIFRRFGPSAEDISNPAHDAPADGQNKSDAQKSNH